jgi:hypothetical protein
MILHGTQGRISMRGKDGDWHDITAGVRDVDLTLSSLCIQHAQDQEMQRALETALSKLRALLEVSADA